MNNRRLSHAGFTLLEMIVATALCSVLLLALWTMYSTYADLFDRGQARVERSQLSRALMQQIADDLRAAIQDPIAGAAEEPGGGAQRRRFGLSGTSRELRFDVLQVTPLQGYQPAIGRGGPDQEDTAPRVPELRTITYSLAVPPAASETPSAEPEAGTAERGLLRQELDFETPVESADAPDLESIELVPAEAGDDTRTLVPEVLSVQFRYFDGRGWSSSWNSLQRKSLPAAVEVTLTLGDPDAAAEEEQLVEEEPEWEDEGEPLPAPLATVTTTLQTIVDLPASSLYRQTRRPQATASTARRIAPPRAATPRRIAPPRWSRSGGAERQRPEDWIRTGAR